MGIPDSEGYARTNAKEGRYVNFFQVGHGAFEFIVDFGQYDPHGRTVQMHTRIVTGPAYAKLLANLLQDSVARYEAEHGSIKSLGDECDPAGASPQPGAP